MVPEALGNEEQIEAVWSGVLAGLEDMLTGDAVTIIAAGVTFTAVNQVRVAELRQKVEDCQARYRRMIQVPAAEQVGARVLEAARRSGDGSLGSGLASVLRSLVDKDPALAGVAALLDRAAGRDREAFEEYLATITGLTATQLG